MALHVRPARASDHALFAALFPELATGDAIVELDAFVRELVPTMVIAEEGPPGGPDRPLGYAYYQIMKETAYVRHIVTAPEARRAGVGRALMAAILARARDAACSTWCLNVKPDNGAAIALYEGLGMTAAHRSRVVSVPWSVVDGAMTASEAGVVARPIPAEDDARVEALMHLVHGQLATSRALGDRVLTMLEAGGIVVGAASFAPSFPGAYPFRVQRPELALVLLRALRPHARAIDTQLSVVTEGQPGVADVLVAMGATSKLEMVHMRGALPRQVRMPDGRPVLA